MLDDALKLNQVAVEEVTGTGQHDHRQALWPRPREHRSERYYIILLTVNHKRVLRHRLDHEAPDRGRDQDQSLGRRSAFA